MGTMEHISVKFNPKYNNYHGRKSWNVLNELLWSVLQSIQEEGLYAAMEECYSGGPTPDELDTYCKFAAGCLTDPHTEKVWWAKLMIRDPFQYADHLKG